MATAYHLPVREGGTNVRVSGALVEVNLGLPRVNHRHWQILEMLRVSRR